MLIIPAIDILKGECVRLYQGDYSRAVRYAADPAEVARGFQEAGAVRIHIVDLDAARGSGTNRDSIRRVRDAVSCTIQVGGGVREDDDLEELESIGVDRVVIGTMLVREPARVARWALTRKNLLAGIDARDGMVRVSGWESGSALSDEGAALRARDLGMSAIIHTDIARDGTLGGPSVQGSVRLAGVSGLPVILSGGIGCLDDLGAVSGHSEIAGVILGRAMFEGKVDLRAAVESFQTDGETHEVSW